MKAQPWFAAALLLLLSALAIPAYSKNGSKPCPPVSAKNKQEALKMETSSDKNGCWVRDKSGNLYFVSSASPENNYKALLNPEPAARSSRPKLDPTAGIVGNGELAGEWRVHFDEYTDIDNGTDGKYDIFCRGWTVGGNSSGDGTVMIGWDHIPHWKCTGSCNEGVFGEFSDSDPDWHVPPLRQTEIGTYMSEHSQTKRGLSFEHVVGLPYKPYKYGNVVEKYSYKIVVTGNTFVGVYTPSQDQTPENGHRDVVCLQQVYRAERILPTKP